MHFQPISSLFFWQKFQYIIDEHKVDGRIYTRQPVLYYEDIPKTFPPSYCPVLYEVTTKLPLRSPLRKIEDKKVPTFEIGSIRILRSWVHPFRI